MKRIGIDDNAEDSIYESAGPRRLSDTSNDFDEEKNLVMIRQDKNSVSLKSKIIL